MLDLNHVSMTFNPGTVNEKKALTDINLHMESGEFATIVGSNGAGKSISAAPRRLAACSRTRSKALPPT